jgi:hypothetical protein
VQGWEESWIDATHKIICDKYDCSYASTCPDLSGDTDDDNYIAVGSVNLVTTLLFSPAFLTYSFTVFYILK